MRHGILALVVALLPIGRGFAQVGPSIDEVRANLDQWVQTRQLTSRLQADWRAEKEMLDQTATLFEKELSELEARVSEADTGVSQVNTERREYEARQRELEEVRTRVAERATRLEQRIRTLAIAFPPPLAIRLEPLLQRLPDDPANTRLSPLERMQNVVGILNEVDKFNSSIAVESDLQKRPSGEEIQVKTVYVGLGHGYFVDKTGAFAGVGVATLDGWRWAEQPELGDRILRVLAIHDNQQPPAFETLPMTVN